MIEENADVLVAGGGTAGAVAAIQAARAGATTSLVEMSGQLGGTMTSGGVNFPGYFYAWGELQVAGIGWELVKETKELSSEALPPVRNAQEHRPGNYIPINMGIYAALAEEKALQAGVTLHYHEVVAAVDRVDDAWHVHTVGKNTRRVIHAKEIIDCTGDADLVGMVGLEREMADVRQPGTLEFILAGYDLDPGDYAGMDAKSFMHFLHEHGRNQSHVIGVDGTTSATQSEANIRGRQALLRLFRFIKSLPGGERVTLERMSARPTALSAKPGSPMRTILRAGPSLTRLPTLRSSWMSIRTTAAPRSSSIRVRCRRSPSAR